MKAWNNKDITGKQISRSMNLSYISGTMGILWLVTATPQQILTVFVKNHLGASSTQLGLLVGIINVMALLHLASIGFYQWTNGRKKAFFIFTTIVQRSMAFLMAFAAFRVAAGGSRQESIYLVLLAGIIGAVMGNSSGSGWWAWMGDLIPADKRSAFFGRRSSLSQLVNVVFFFSATLVLDLYVRQVFLVYGFLFLLGGIGGVTDVLLHVFIPEPRVIRGPKQTMTFHQFFLPLRDREFRRFCLILGFYLFSFNLAAPFIAPYTTDPLGGGAPNVWLGITFVISQMTWVLMAPFWGMLMDRMGKKPVVMIGGLMVISWLGYLVLNPGNYMVVLPLIALVGGFFAPAFWEGISQFMMALSPDEHRTSYSAWYWTAFGVSGALSPLLGGVIYDFLSTNQIHIGSFEPSPFQLVVVISVVLVLFSLTHMGRITTLRDKSVRTLVSTILNPGVFRAVSNISILSRPTRADVVQKTLWDSRGGALNLSFSEICIRLDDPSTEVREAAAMALARLGTCEAEDQLVQRLRDLQSLSRPIIARALGHFTKISQDRQIRIAGVLQEALNDGYEEVQIEAAASLGRLGVYPAAEGLLKNLRESDSMRVRVSSAEAAARLGVKKAGGEIFHLMHQTTNWILRRQLAIALGDLFGSPGEIYHYMTGELSRNIQALYTLAELTEKRLTKKIRKLTQDKSGKKIEFSGDIRGLQKAAIQYERGNYAEAFDSLLRIWREIPIHFVEEPGLDIIREYWSAVQEYLDGGGNPQAQDVVLGMYSMFKSLGD